MDRFPHRILVSTCGIVRVGIRARWRESPFFGLWPRGSKHGPVFGTVLRSAFHGPFSGPDFGASVWSSFLARNSGSGASDPTVGTPACGPLFEPRKRSRNRTANFARCSGFELHLTFACPSFRTEVGVKVSSHVAECGNDTAVLQHFLRSMQPGGSRSQLAKRNVAMIPKNDSDGKLSENAVWAFPVHFVQF